MFERKFLYEYTNNSDASYVVADPETSELSISDGYTHTSFYFGIADYFSREDMEEHLEALDVLIETINNFRTGIHNRFVELIKANAAKEAGKGAVNVASYSDKAAENHDRRVDDE